MYSILAINVMALKGMLDAQGWEYLKKKKVVIFRLGLD
jgi:hypothetical protein